MCIGVVLYCDQPTPSPLLSQVIAFDIDPAALAIAQQNCVEFEVENIDFVLADIEKLQLKWNTTTSTKPTNSKNTKNKPFDVVVMNPPFGTKNKGIDMIFLQKAIEVCNEMPLLTTHYTTRTTCTLHAPMYDT